MTVISSTGRWNRGFTYPVVLVAVVIMAIAAETATRLTSTVARREIEEELLFRGIAYRNAIAAFYHADPDKPSYPRSIEELLRDPRFPQRRHLRAAYPDPTGGEWRLIMGEGNRLVGVASSSGREPLKRAGFPAELALFAGARRLSEWEFIYLPEPGAAAK